MADFKINTDQELIIEDGDFVIENDNRDQITFQLLSQAKGNFKEFPNICINMNSYLNSNINPNLVINAIKDSLTEDGFRDVEVTGTLNNLKISGKRNDL